MIATRGVSVAELDKRASEADSPFAVITADCSSPHEIDDAVSVEVLPSAQELYRVSVFAVDTSGLYKNETLVKDVLRKTESVYMNPGSSVEDYQPMLPEGLIRKLHFSKGKKPKSALAVSFMVGEGHPPSDVDLSFGHVEVTSNMHYRRFGEKCRYSPSFAPYGRASAYILQHLSNAGNVEQNYSEIMHVPTNEGFRRGANINQSFMVAACYLVAREWARSGHLGMYRVHDPVNSSMNEVLSPRLAYFSESPGRHLGLGLDTYTRVTSPLRRAEDFVMHGLIRAIKEGEALTGRDRRIVASAVQRLNQRIAYHSFMGAPRMRDEDLWTISEEEAQQESSLLAALRPGEAVA